ncbi:MAG: protein-disulfide reductase DsbD family protein [Cyclobacteriaceae bacterium]|nr:protein-disulfide reductase DsbD family protein [Cyclobacteriaceae bacterium]
MALHKGMTVLRNILISILFFNGYFTAAQILKPAKWSWTPSATTLKTGSEVDLIFTVTTDKNWYVYANDFDPDCGPMLTTVTFEKHPSFTLVGGLQAINPLKKHDEIFDCEVKIFKDKGEFRQRIKVLSENPVIKGVIEGQTCTEVDGRCIPFEEDFVITGLTVTGKEKYEEGQVALIPDQPAQIAQPAEPEVLPVPTSVYGAPEGPKLDPSILEGENELNDESFFGYLVFAFVLGIVSLITPCVFPMVPMTVTFFLRDNQSRRQGIRNALIFGASIITIYTLAGTLFAILLGAEGLNALATHWAPNLFVFVIFVVFALSFLGMFEITAPHQLVNKADQQAEKGGLIGIFFMAATLVLVSFSCTIPIVGNVVVLSAGGQVIKPVLAMFSYSLAFAIPFTLFAIFPEWMKGLPKSGGWLNAVKVTLGFLELALALKFLSIADQAYHWGILDRDVNIVLWIVIFGLLGLYLLGKIRLPHDSPVEKISVPRLLLAITVFSFVVYLVPGLWGAPLKALAGYLPPQHTHDFDLVAMTRNARENAICDEPRYAEFLHLPHGLKGYFDYAQALACARAQDKPLFIDFTGHGCTNCREMEAVVWSDPAVLERLKNDFVIVALYVDDKTLLPESEWVTSTYDGKVKKTLGKKNADLQITRLNNNAQPFYVLVGKDERVLAWPYGYDRNVEKFVDFLERGKKKYKELYQ